MNSVYLLTGGNIGNRIENLASAATLIENRIGRVTASSSIYETAAWGVTEQPSFLNQVLCVQTGMQPRELLQHILQIELALGRTRHEKMGPRTIDIDILLFGDLVINLPDLVIPHPHMASRRFVLAPLAQIAPSLVHPVLQQSIADLLAACADPLPVELFG